MKMRVLYSSSKGKMITFASEIAQAKSCGVDVIPPAFSCDKERLVILGFSLKKDLDDEVRRFCRELTKQRAYYTAIFTDAPKDSQALKTLIACLEEAGTTVIDDILYVDGGMPFKFMKKITPEEKETAIKWADSVMSKVE